MLNRAVVTKTIVVSTLLALVGCAAAPPQDTGNACEIFKQYPDWYVSAKESERRWGTPVPVMLAIIHQESRFEADVSPERVKIFGIPTIRKSSSYGYTQALDSTWKDYQRATGNRSGSRDNFHDSVDFIGWYNYQTYKVNGVERNNTYYLYMAYHEGHTGYKQKSWQDKQWLKDVATKVANRAITYDKQLKSCRLKVNKNERWWVF